MKSKSLIPNFLTFDIEEWFHANYESVDTSKYVHMPSSLPNLVDILIEEMATYEIHSTCFIVGTVAQKHPQMVKKLHAAGHEIASHSMHHRLVHSLTPEEFEEDTRESCEVLENLTGEKVRGYRAPSWSVKKETLSWFYPVLHKLGIDYSSSVFPVANYLYGIDGVSMQPHIIKLPMHQRMHEIPCSVSSLWGKKFGFSGGFYFRLFPSWFIKRAAGQLNHKGLPVVYYLHPREIDINQDTLELPLFEKFIHYWGINGTLPKLQTLMKDIAPSTMRMDHYVQSVV